MEKTRRARRLLPLWTLLWLVAGSFHLVQAIVGSGGSALPGDLGDARFNHLVLEHGYQSARGHYAWRSPGQFFPVPHTLGWSDTHLGTLPLYATGRLLGLAPERALQGWFLLCAGLNLWAGWRLLGRLGVDPWLAPPATGVAFAAAPWVWVTGTHAQLLPLFPTLLAAHALLGWVATRARRELLGVVGGLSLQFAAGPYLAFFALLALIAAGLTGLILRPGPTATTPERRHGPGPVFLLAVGLAGAGLNLWVYLSALEAGAGRPLQELIDLTPTWTAWFSAPPVHAWYPAGWPAGSAPLGEQVLFAGFTVWLLGLAAGPAGLRRDASPTLRLAAVCALAGLLLVLFVVKWPNGFSLWLTLAERVEPLRAFRAIGRISILTHSLLACSAALVLTSLWRSSRWRRWAWLPTIVLLLESLAWRQPAYAVADAQARRAAIVSAWREAGDRPVLAFAPGFTNQPPADLHLDAWAAALSVGRVTLNGYSGGAPASHLPFLWSPTADNAAGLMHLMSLPAESVSLVTTLADETARRLGYHLQAQRPLERLDDFDLQPVAWSLFSPLERHVIDGIPFYQFTPTARVQFRLPDEARRIGFLTGLRPGAWENGGDSDGYALTWWILDEDGRELGRETRLFNPRDRPADRGFLLQTILLPAGTARRLHLEFGPGPSGLSNWDWPLLARLRVDR